MRKAIMITALLAASLSCFAAGTITVSGSISFILRPEGAGTVFLLALGGTDTVASGEDGKYTHTMHLCEVNDNLPGATIIVDRKAKVMKYAGCTVSALSLKCAAGDYVKATLDIQGVKEEAGTLNASLKSFTVPSYRCTAAVFTIGDEVYDISSSTVKRACTRPCFNSLSASTAKAAAIPMPLSAPSVVPRAFTHSPST